MKKFIGYYIIGANTKEDAQNEKGLMLWSPNKPNALKRWLNETLLGIYWVDKDRIVQTQEKGKTMQNQEQPVELAKVKEEKTAPVMQVEKPAKLQEAPRKPRQTPRVKPNK
jgi:hypothetical protein